MSLAVNSKVEQVYMFSLIWSFTFPYNSHFMFCKD